VEELEEICLAALEQIPEGVIIINDEDHIVFINQKAAEIRRIQATERIGKPVLDCHPPESRERVLRALQFIKNNPDRPFVRIVQDKEKDLFYENTYSCLQYGQNGSVGSVVISRDITEKRKLEKELASRMKSLEENNQELTTRLESLFISAMTSMANVLEAKDPYTNGHSARVGKISVRIAEQIMGISPELKEIELASELHDIGKVGIREEILNKKGPLSDEEQEHMMRHPAIGWDILQPFRQLKEVAIIVRHHHERYDGKGYPDRLAGDDIPIPSQIIAIADCYDAMTSDRPYRPAMKSAVAATEIEKNLGTQFNPKIGGVFLELFHTGSI
jgi:PAS domain S-box-containing protein